MNHSEPPLPGRIAIVGAGALGSLIAGRLSRSAAPVVLLNRPSPHLDRIRAAGLTLVAPDGATERIAVSVSSNPAAVADASIVIVAVKTWATDAALRPLRDWLEPSAWVVTLQNGIGNAERIRDALGPRPRLALGVTALGAARLEPGVVRAGGVGPTLFGVPGQSPPPILRALAAAFTAAGMPAVAVADIKHAIWRKLAVNAAINGLTALAAMPNGAILDDPDLRAAAITIAREVEAVARAEGHEIGDVERAVAEVARATASNRSSMRQDLEAGGPTEVEAIYGAIVARAARHGLAVPANETIAAILRARPPGGRGARSMTESDGSERVRARKLTIPAVRARKGGEPLAMIAAYDVPFARLAQAAGVDLLLVGDSLGMVVLGYESTVPVTMDDILHHCRAVVRGAPDTLVVADLPFLSYHLDDRQAIENAGRLLKEGGADAVKLEGGRGMADRIRAVVAAGIPAMGHIGLTPQSAAALGGFKIQGRDLDSAQALIDDALAIADAGVFAMVVEAVPDEVAAIITERASVPTIGIGAGPACDGQVLVGHDLLGIDPAPPPRFVRRYADLAPTIRDAFARYAADVRSGAFPGPDESFHLKPEVARQLAGEPR